jgi:hypothetical protein
MFKPGDYVQVKILKFDRYKEHISLTLKQLIPRGVAIKESPFGVEGYEIVPSKNILLLEIEISASTLILYLKEILNEIYKNQIQNQHIVFKVTNNKNKFVVGSEEICGRVLELFDEEYGWAKFIDVEEINNVEKIQPGNRSHPFIYEDGNLSK